MGSPFAVLQRQFVDHLLFYLHGRILNREFINLLSLQQDHAYPGFLASNFTDFYQATQENLDKLAQILEEDNVEFSNINPILRCFKDSSSIIGAEDFVRQCVEFRRNSHAKDKEGCLSCLERTKTAYCLLQCMDLLVWQVEEAIVELGGTILVPSVNETITRVAEYQFEYVDYTSSLMDRNILIIERDPKYQARNLNNFFTQVPILLDNLLKEFRDTETFIDIHSEIQTTLRGMADVADSAGVTLAALLPIRNALKSLKTWYNKKHTEGIKSMEGCLESMEQARTEFNLLKRQLEPILEMERQISEASMPKPLVKHNERIGAGNPDRVYVRGGQIVQPSKDRRN
ncbi:uncharacterized protein [Spinacia oleracea]|uniref:Histidine-containing phosphotransfer protein n=1 Tax=Spinacia oleracea TaxID=3562 RepID=A0ABM3QM96_SPIOL|nr:uncharacterized protein LOC130460846 [Spinacia oleracea]